MLDSIDSRHSLEWRTVHAGDGGDPSARPDRGVISTACARCGKKTPTMSQSAAGRPALCEECYLVYQSRGGAI